MKTKRVRNMFSIILFVALTLSAQYAGSDSPKRNAIQGAETTQYMILLHQKHIQELSSEEMSSSNQSIDIGNIAVMKGDKKTYFPRNPFGLLGKKISFIPNSKGGYDVKVSSGTISGEEGDSLGTAPIYKKLNFTSGFSFPFYRVDYTSLFVDGCGCLSFGADCSNAYLPAALSGPPMILPFEASCAEKVYVLQTATKFTATWRTSSNYRTDAQVNLFNDGTIEFLYEGNVTDDGLTGITPGNTTLSNLKLVNFSRGSIIQGGPKTAVFEEFRSVNLIDPVQLLQEFHRTHPQIFDFVTIFTDRPYASNQYYDYPFFTGVQNSIRGIGLGRFNDSEAFGSSKIQGFIIMNSIASLPVNPHIPVEGTYNTLQLMAKLHGHRWVPYPRVLINGKKTDDLLGYVMAHPRGKIYRGRWSFFMDTDASVMGGNDIRDNGDGTFTTTASTLRYSNLDLYLMGLIPSTAVPQVFFVRAESADCNPFEGECTARSPQVGVTFGGNRVNVTVKKIIQAEGVRVPSSTTSQKQFREAFIFFIPAGVRPDPKEIARIDEIRTMWKAFFTGATDGHATVDTSLK